MKKNTLKKAGVVLAVLLGLTGAGFEIYGVVDSNSKATEAVATAKDADAKAEEVKKTTGAAGKDGTSILTGKGSPLSDNGKIGDVYIDIETYNLYKKSNEGWTLIGNILGDTGVKGDAGEKGDTGATGAKGDKGDKGDTGAAGKDGADGAQGPKGDKGDTGATGAKGDKGDKGDAGKDGTSLRNGHGVPAEQLGIDGDTYIDLDTWDIYIKAEGTWTKFGNIKGEKGADGKDGADGAQGEKGDTGAAGKDGKDATEAAKKEAASDIIYKPSEVWTATRPLARIAYDKPSYDDIWISGYVAGYNDHELYVSDGSFSSYSAATADSSKYIKVSTQYGYALNKDLGVSMGMSITIIADSVTSDYKSDAVYALGSLDTTVLLDGMFVDYGAATRDHGTF